MGFFHTDDGLLHSGRIAGLFYVFALVLGCGWLDAFAQMCVMRATFTVGWWLVFGDKHMPRTFRELTRHPLRLVGGGLVLVGVVGQSYLVWAHRAAHG